MKASCYWFNGRLRARYTGSWFTSGASDVLEQEAQSSWPALDLDTLSHTNGGWNI